MDKDIEALFQRAVDLEEGDLDSFIEELAKEQPQMADELRELLANEKGPLGDQASPGFASNEAWVRFADSILERLRDRGQGHTRYSIQDKVAEGGQGAVLDVWDEDLQRHIAMKVILGGEGKSKASSAVDSRSLGRFLEEAQVTAQLDHPGIVPVHELGIDADGRVYFTMKLVKGETLNSVFQGVRSGAGWTTTRAVGLLLRVCEAMSYAHAKGVVHRDLKPSNVMVGRFGEVFVMDWGLARVLGQKDRKDIRIQPAATSEIHSFKRTQERTPDSPLITMDGDVVGTPAYMSPEQAKGETETIGPASDIYAVGAMLYELLAGHMPYVKPGVRINNYGLWYQVQQGPPESLDSRAPEAPAELKAIANKAMARDSGKRYASMGELAADLRAYLENRVVSAYRSGVIVEIRKWVRRNPLVAGSMALVLVASGVAAWFYLWAQESKSRLRDVRIAAELLERLDGTPLDEDAPALWHSWLVDAERAVRDLPKYQRGLEDLRREADGETAPLSEDPSLRLLVRKAKNLEALLAMWESALVRKRGIAKADETSDKVRDRELHAIATIERERALRRDELRHLKERLRKTRPIFEDAGARSVYSQVEGLVKNLVSIDRAIEDVRGTLGLLEEAHRSFQDGEVWERAIAAVGDPQSPYEGLALRPQFGLVPLGPDSGSGLWEFWHMFSGERPERAADGQLIIADDTGLVFVLIPAGGFYLGSQADSPDLPNYDRGSTMSETPITYLEVDAFFLSKFELTQGQWIRFTKDNPSAYFSGSDWRGFGTITRTHPVENISWNEATEVLAKYRLHLPTEVQWEYASRAGTSTPYWFGTSVHDQRTAVNYFDRSAQAGRVAQATTGTPPSDDGHPLHGPVSNWDANPFGLCATAGNVAEYCSDGFVVTHDIYDPDYESTPVVIEGVVVRGGSYLNPMHWHRSAQRASVFPWGRSNSVGVRPCRAIE